MATFLLTWNPDKWPWPDVQLRAEVEATARGERVPGRWSLGGRRQGVAVGDQAMLVRQQRERGVVASGAFVSEIYWDEHWDGSGRQTTYADVEWDVVADAGDRLPVEILKLRVPEVRWNRLQASGVKRRLRAEAVG